MDSVLGVCNYGYVLLSHLENTVMRIETTTTGGIDTMSSRDKMTLK